MKSTRLTKQVRLWLTVVALAVPVAPLLSSLPARADTGLSGEQLKQFQSGETVKLTSYDVVEDRTTTSSMQIISKDISLMVSFSSPGKNQVKPEKISIAVASVHQAFRWNQVSQLMLRYGGKLHTVSLSQLRDGKPGYTIELNKDGGGWIETVFIKPSTSEFLEMAGAQVIHGRVGDNPNDTFSLEAKTLGALKSIAEEIATLQPDVTQDALTQTAEGVAATYSQELFNPNTTKLTPNYKGHSPVEVYNGLVKMLAPKTEFETTAAFNRRRAEAMQKPILGSLTLRDTFVAQVDLKAGNSTISYDADKSLMRVDVTSLENFVDVPLWQNRVVSGRYTGQNAYGAEREITQIQGENINLVFTNHKAFGIKKGSVYTTMRFEFPAPVNKAIAIKPNLQMLVVYNLQAPFVGSRLTGTTPKIDDPFEYNIKRFYINAVVRGLWFYNSETGEVVAKMQPHR